VSDRFAWQFYNRFVDHRALRIAGTLILTTVLCACARGNGQVADTAPTPSGCPCLDREFSLKVGPPVTIQGQTSMFYGGAPVEAADFRHWSAYFGSEA